LLKEIAGMAEHASDHTHGQMDIHQQQASFDVFVAMTKWGSLAVAVVVLTAAIWTCTELGWLTAVVAGLVVAAAGVFFLRDKPDAAAAH
jgi:hypothetical protein